MMGPSSNEEQGIIPRLCADLFQRIEQITSQDESVSAKVEVSYLEIYKERVRDLLTSDPSRKPRVREHAITGNVL